MHVEPRAEDVTTSVEDLFVWATIGTLGDLATGESSSIARARASARTARGTASNCIRPRFVSSFVALQATSSAAWFRLQLKFGIGDVIIRPASRCHRQLPRLYAASRFCTSQGPRGPPNAPMSVVLPRAPSSISHPPATFSKPHDTATERRRRRPDSPSLTAAGSIVVDVGAQAAAAAGCQRQSTGNSIPAA